MTVSDLIPTNYGSGTIAAPYDGSNLWGTAPNGYTVGPNYWGMTFYAWPPDPNNDWRQLYFLNSSGAPWNNCQLYPSPAPADIRITTCYSRAAAYLIVLRPATTRSITRRSWPGLTPIASRNRPATAGRSRPVLRSSNQIFYSSIPTDVPVSAYTWSNPNSTNYRSQRALLEGIYRLRDWRVAGPHRHHSDSRHVHVQLRPRLYRRRVVGRLGRQHLRPRFHGLPQRPREPLPTPARAIPRRRPSPSAAPPPAARPSPGPRRSPYPAGRSPAASPLPASAPDIRRYPPSPSYRRRSILRKLPPVCKRSPS